MEQIAENAELAVIKQLELEARLRDMAEHYDMRSKLSEIVTALVADPIYTKADAAQALLQVLSDMELNTPVIPNAEEVLSVMQL